MNPPSPTYPLFLKLAGVPVLLIGGGSVALRRLEGLLEAGGLVTVVSPEVHPRIAAYHEEGRLRWRRRPFLPQDLEGQKLAFLAAGDAELARDVREMAARRGVLLNTAGEESTCDFHVPAVVEHRGVRLALSSGGASPGLVKRLREKLEGWLSRAVPEDLDALKERRKEVRRLHEHSPERRLAALRELASSAAEPQGESLDRGGETEPRGGGTEPPGRGPPRPGVVYLVGAGPGDPGLLTVRALELLRGADLVLHDRLVGPAILDLLSPEAERIYAGKEVGRARRANVAELLVEAARSRRRVVRLKGGDPVLYGRGGEEMLALELAGVEYEVVPGVSALCAVPARAGIPVTYRGVSSELVVRSGHRAGKRSSDGASARRERTYIYFMALARLPEIVAELLEEGVGPSTPAAVVAHGTLADEQVVTADLQRLPAAARARGLTPPGLVVVGDVVTFREPERFVRLLTPETALEVSCAPPAPGHLGGREPLLHPIQEKP